MTDPQFFFAWVDTSETTFGPQHERYDEEIVDLTIEQKEGDFATASLKIKNPNRGLLNGPVWAWIAWSDGVTTFPLFFGHLVAIPSRASGLLIQLHLIARPSDYIARRQALAETLKTLPQYDEIFLSPEKRDDPEAIIEGWSGLYHTDRVTHEVTLSDVLIGEDGTINFTSIGNDYALYDGFNITFGQPPLTAISVVASVQWTQATSGALPPISESFSAYTGQALKNGWPKAGQQLGGGWEALHTWAIDASGNEQAFVANLSYHWTNKEKKHHTGDTMSVSISASLIQGGSVGITQTISLFNQPGIIDPFTVDAAGDPDPINQPVIQRMTKMSGMIWDVNCGMAMKYEARRQRREQVSFTLTADVQPFMIDPTISQVTDAITLTGSDLGEPLIELQAWSDFAGGDVPAGTIIFPNDPSVAGQTATQISVSGGTAGTTEPTFSNIPGETTADNGVTWASLGPAGPQANNPDWTPFKRVAVGMVIMPRVPLAIPYSALYESYTASIPPSPVPVEYGQYVGMTGDNSSPDQYTGIEVCTVSGVLFGTDAPTFQPILTRGRDLYMCTQDGESGEFMPVFDFNPGAITDDGTAQWTCIGEVNLPIGGWPGNTPAAYYFPTARGHRSLAHLMCRARAKLRWRSRFAQVSWQGSWETGLALSCRMNAFLDDPRLPGGHAGGKVIEYRLTAQNGRRLCEVTIGAACGNANAVRLTLGTPSYIASDYIDPSYQVYLGAVVPVGDDMAYTPPLPSVVDDGLVFPLTTADDVIIHRATHGTIDEQQAALKTGFDNAVKIAKLNETSSQSNNMSEQLIAQTQVHQLAAYDVNYYLSQVPIWFEMTLKPVQNGPFSAAYVVQVQPLAIPKTIDLSAGPV